MNAEIKLQIFIHTSILKIKKTENTNGGTYNLLRMGVIWGDALDRRLFNYLRFCKNLSLKFIVSDRAYTSAYLKYLKRSADIEFEFPKHVSFNIRKKDRLYTVTSWVYVSNLYRSTKDVDVLFSPEIYSFLSYQSVKVGLKMKKPTIVLVAETIPNHIVTRIPPYSFIVRYLTKNATLFLAMTHKAKKFLELLGVEDEKIIQRVPIKHIILMRRGLPNVREKSAESALDDIQTSTFDGEFHYLFNPFIRAYSLIDDSLSLQKLYDRELNLLKNIVNYSNVYQITFRNSNDFCRLLKSVLIHRV